MAMFSRGGLDLYYELHGAGEPLLLIAGLGSDSQSWQPILADLAARFHVIAVDNRGVGRTAPQDAMTSIGMMADDCVALLEQLHLPRVNVVGHSMGGFIAQELAIRHPARVGSLILAATASASSKRNSDLFRGWADALDHGADRNAWFRNLFYWIFSPRFFNDGNNIDEAVRLAVAYPYPQSSTAFRNQVDAIAAFDSARDLSRLRARTLLIAGSEDILFPVQCCRDFSNRISGSVFAVIEGAAHSIHMECPTSFVERVADFMVATP